LPNIATYINQYEIYLNKELNQEVVETDLITVRQLIDLGYAFEEDYSPQIITIQPGKNWIETNQCWYTKSAVSSIEDVLHWYSSGDFMFDSPMAIGRANAGVRPTVTIPYTTFKELSKTPKESLISFTIDGTSYQGVEGMTWEEWVNSEYNISNYVIGDNNYIVSADNKYIICNRFSAAYAKSNDVIDSRSDIYYLEPQQIK